MTIPKRDFLESFRASSASMSKWIVAYGVGMPVIILSQESFSHYLIAQKYFLVVLSLFLTGSCLKVISELVYKYISWPLHLGEGDETYRKRTSYKICKNLYNSLLFEAIFDIPAVILLFTGTIWTFSILSRYEPLIK